MYNSNDFICIDENVVEIGIDISEAENVFKSLADRAIKKEYITASTPRKIIKNKRFNIQKKLVTLDSFRKFILETGYITEAEKEGWGWVWDHRWIKRDNVSWANPFGNDYDVDYNEDEKILPVMQVSWNDANEYTKWVSKKNGKIFRLPFEYEWELFGNYAGLKSIKLIINNNNEKIDTTKMFLSELRKKIVTSEFQLGLLWEWTNDWYLGYDEDTINRDFGEIYKTLRGGSLMSEEFQKTKEFRFRRCPTARSPYYGFRMVMEI